MPNLVSIIVWRDAKTDPPKGDRSILVHDQFTGFTAAGRFYRDDVEKLGITHWAERPVVSDLTDDDVKLAADCIGWESDWALGKTDGSEADRLRAALGGEKGEA